MVIKELEAHHKGTPHGNAGGGKGGGKGNGGGSEVPEIDGGALPLALLAVFCVALLFRKFKGSKEK